MRSAVGLHGIVQGDPFSVQTIVGLHGAVQGNPLPVQTIVGLCGQCTVERPILCPNYSRLVWDNVR